MLPFLELNWMYLGISIVPIIMLYLFYKYKNFSKIFTDYRSLLAIGLVIYIIHQFEEHGIDLFGNRYAFMNFFNGLFHHFPIFNCGSNPNCPIDQLKIMLINTVLVWVPFILAMIRGTKQPFIGHCAMSTIPTNAMTHIMSAIVHKNYNPGVFTSVILFLPYTILFYKRGLQQKWSSPKLIMGGLVYGIFLHVFLIGSLLLKSVPTALITMMYILFILIPFLFFRHQKHSD